MFKRTDFYTLLYVGLFVYSFETKHYYFAAAFAAAMIFEIITGNNRK